MEFQNFSGASMRAMMAVMKQSDEADLLFQREYLIHHLRIIPLMQQDDMSFFQLLFEESRKFVVCRLVETDVEFGIDAAEGINSLDSALAFLLHQVRKRP